MRLLEVKRVLCFLDWIPMGFGSFCVVCVDPTGLDNVILRRLAIATSEENRTLSKLTIESQLFPWR